MKRKKNTKVGSLLFIGVLAIFVISISLFVSDRAKINVESVNVQTPKDKLLKNADLVSTTGFSKNSGKLDTFLSTYSFSGVALGVTKNYANFQKGYGVANYGTRTPIKPTTYFSSEALSMLANHVILYKLIDGNVLSGNQSLKSLGQKGENSSQTLTKYLAAGAKVLHASKGTDNGNLKDLSLTKYNQVGRSLIANAKNGTFATQLNKTVIYPLVLTDFGTYENFQNQSDFAVNYRLGKNGYATYTKPSTVKTDSDTIATTAVSAYVFAKSVITNKFNLNNSQVSALKKLFIEDSNGNLVLNENSQDRYLYLQINKSGSQGTMLIGNTQIKSVRSKAVNKLAARAELKGK